MHVRHHSMLHRHFVQMDLKFDERVPANKGQSNFSTFRRFCCRLATQKLTVLFWGKLTDFIGF